VGEAEDGEGGFFEGVEGFFEETAEAGPAAFDVVVAAVDAAVVEAANG
jgi:hypothetical protein